VGNHNTGKTNRIFSFGLTDPSGYYKLQLDSVKAGVTVGKKAVRISTTRKILGLNSAEEGGESNSEGAPKAAPEPEKVPTKYNQKSELTADVTPSQSQFNFELTSK
jgi:hypothetical protein